MSRHYFQKMLSKTVFIVIQNRDVYYTISPIIFFLRRYSRGKIVASSKKEQPPTALLGSSVHPAIRVTAEFPDYFVSSLRVSEVIREKRPFCFQFLT